MDIINYWLSRKKIWHYYCPLSHSVNVVSTYLCSNLLMLLVLFFHTYLCWWHLRDWGMHRLCFIGLGQVLATPLPAKYPHAQAPTLPASCFSLSQSSSSIYLLRYGTSPSHHRRWELLLILFLLLSPKPTIQILMLLCYFYYLHFHFLNFYTHPF